MKPALRLLLGDKNMLSRTYSFATVVFLRRLGFSREWKSQQTERKDLKAKKSSLN